MDEMDARASSCYSDGGGPNRQKVLNSKAQLQNILCKRTRTVK
jgi:hypothetical protein